MCVYPFAAYVHSTKYLHEKQPFLYATDEISTSGKALVHEVIPYFDLLTGHVDRAKLNTQFSPVIRAAAERGRRMLDKYYSFTDDSIVYRIAISLSSPFACLEPVTYC